MAKDKELLSSLLNSDETDADKIIKELSPEENKVALELLEEKIDGTDEDTPPKSTDGTDDEEITETPEDDDKKDKGEGDKQTPPDDEVVEEDEELTLTEDFIKEQPEEIRGILSKYQDKGKEDIALAVANAVAMKSPYLKDNEKLINQMKEQFLEKGNDELIQILVETQKESGKVEDQEAIKPEPPKLVLPEIPKDDPEIGKILEKETLKRLKAKYPNMPEEIESMNDEKYKEWRRDLDADNPDNEFRTDKARTEAVVTEELAKVIYIQKELPNLYEESPTEVLPLFTNENLPRLKALNDNPMNVLVEDIQSEVEIIKNGLKKYGITEKDLGIDFTITKDEKGMPFNPILNQLIAEGKTADGKLIPSSKIIGSRGKTFWLKKGELARKFREEYDAQILTAVMNSKVKSDRIHKDKLKDETLREASGSGGGGRKALTVEDIEKEKNPERIKQILADLEKV